MHFFIALFTVLRTFDDFPFAFVKADNELIVYTLKVLIAIIVIKLQICHAIHAMHNASQYHVEIHRHRTGVGSIPAEGPYS